MHDCLSYIVIDQCGFKHNNGLQGQSRLVGTQFLERNAEVSTCNDCLHAQKH